MIKGHWPKYHPPTHVRWRESSSADCLHERSSSSVAMSSVSFSSLFSSFSLSPCLSYGVIVSWLTPSFCVPFCAQTLVHPQIIREIYSSNSPLNSRLLFSLAAALSEKIDMRASTVSLTSSLCSLWLRMVLGYITFKRDIPLIETLKDHRQMQRSSGNSHYQERVFVWPVHSLFFHLAAECTRLISAGKMLARDLNAKRLSARHRTFVFPFHHFL